MEMGNGNFLLFLSKNETNKKEESKANSLLEANTKVEFLLEQGKSSAPLISRIQIARSVHSESKGPEHCLVSVASSGPKSAL